ncbi:hypothetical protein HPB52_004323 [Rhipicephalus sanguineus]|uniref:Uncharacterized protein n=1 Tax=Rhipicephalus sanguineus TaxID=34632 RepID=A0A9D4PKR6_RHISA|nr:hypothetical protein HPB52_004323 [Rhipicephalus sanguineus]
MEYVEGQEVSPEELSGGSWQSPGLCAQEKRRPALGCTAAAITTPTTMPTSPPSKQTSASPSRPRCRAPIPHLPADTIHVIGRPKTSIDLNKLQPWHLYSALLQAANFQDLPPTSCDRVRIHPVNNTLTLSVADSARAQAYLRITSLTVSSTTFTVHLYAPPPDDALRGILYHAFDDFTDEAILEDLQASNSTFSIVGGRRMGKTPHILVALTEPKGSPPTCTPCCIVSNGNHLTHSSKCKHRYAQRPQHPLRQKTLPTANRSLSQQPADAAPTPKNAMACGTMAPPKLPLPPAKTTSVFLSLAEMAPKAASQPTHSARSSPAAPPVLSLPQVAAMQQENASLRQQLAAQGMLLEAEKTEITSLQAQLSTLEQKLEAALDRLSTIPSSTASVSDMDTQPAHGLYTFLRKSKLPSKRPKRILRGRLSSRFNSVHQLLTTQHEALNSLRTNLAAFPSITSIQSLQETVDTLHAFMLDSVRAKPPLHTRASNTTPAARPSQSQAEETHLLLHLQQLDPPDTPDVLVLQETNSAVSLSGYIAHNQVAHHPAPHPVTVILTQWTLTVNLVDLPFPAVTEDSSLLALLRAAAVAAAKSAFLGYTKADGPGTRLWQLAHDLHLTLLTDLTQPTHVGNSVCRNTTRDLSYCCYVRDAL